MSQTHMSRGNRQLSLREAFEASAWNLLRESILPLLEKEDEEHLNVFHYAIKANNLDAVEYFLALETLNRKDHSPTVPYFHYAAYTGNVEILKLFRSKQVAYCSLAISGAQDELLNEFPKMDQKSKHSSLRDYTPLDIAAACSNWDTVVYLLKDKDYSDNGLNAIRQYPDYLSTAAFLGSAECVRYLLEREPYIVGKTIALLVAFQNRLPNCIKLLLERIPTEENAFQDVSPFHSLYLFSWEGRTSVPKGQGLLDCTKLLLTMGFSVEDPAPQGAYPLYTLLEKMSSGKEQKRLEDFGYHIKCLTLLLEAGADPNFQEGNQSIRDYDIVDSGLIDRELHYNSSFEALLDNDNNLEIKHTKWDEEMENFLTEVIKLLIQYGANVHGWGEGKSALYSLFAKMGLRHLGLDHYIPHQTISLLMSHGCKLWDSCNSGMNFDILDQEVGDDVKEASGPLGIFFEILFSEMKRSETTFETWCESDACYNLGRYFSMMNAEDGRLLACILKVARFYNSTDNDTAIVFIKETFSQFLNRNLFTLSTLVVRKCMGENWSRLDELELPVIVTSRMKALLPP